MCSNKQSYLQKDLKSDVRRSTSSQTLFFNDPNTDLPLLFLQLWQCNPFIPQVPMDWLHHHVLVVLNIPPSASSPFTISAARSREPLVDVHRVYFLFWEGEFVEASTSAEKDNLWEFNVALEQVSVRVQRCLVLQTGHITGFQTTYEEKCGGHHTSVLENLQKTVQIPSWHQKLDCLL